MYIINQKAFINLNVIAWDGKIGEGTEEQTGAIRIAQWADRKERGTLSWEFVIRRGSKEITQPTPNQNGLNRETAAKPIKD